MLCTYSNGIVDNVSYRISLVDHYHHLRHHRHGKFHITSNHSNICVT